MSLLWGIARKLLGLQCPSFAQRYPYILSWKWLWSFGRPHSTAKICQLVPPLPNKMIKVCNSGYAQKSPYWDLTFLGIIIITITIIIKIITIIIIRKAALCVFFSSIGCRLSWILFLTPSSSFSFHLVVIPALGPRLSS